MTFNNRQETMASLFLSGHIRWPNEHLKTKNQVKELCKQFNIMYDSVLFIHGQIGRRSRWQWYIMIPLGHTIASQQWNPVVIAIVTSSVTSNFRYITPMTLTCDTWVGNQVWELALSMVQIFQDFVEQIWVHTSRSLLRQNCTHC